MTGRLARWTLRALLAEKVVQHAFVTWAYAADRFDLREQVAVDWRWLAATGAVAGVLWAVALAGHALDLRGSAALAAGLALFDILGEFVAQGTLAITIVVSFVVAWVVLVLAMRELRLDRDAAAPTEGSARG